MKINRKIWKSSIKAIRNRKRLHAIADETINKLKDSNSSFANDFVQKIQALVRMVKMHISGQYKVQLSSLIYVVFALIYFIVPTDSIPDFIPALGFSDDLTVVYFVFKKIEKDISEFILWENTNLEPNN